MKNITTENLYYILQVSQKRETKFIKQVNECNLDFPYKLHFPVRRLDIRKKGKIKASQAAVFSGYVILQLEEEEKIAECLYLFRKLKGFNRFLISNDNIIPLQDNDLALIMKFISFGPVIGKSKVYFDENSRIVVLQGPLSGLEGNIIKVDRRKKRAKIKLDLYDDSFFIDLAFEVIEKAKQGINE